MLLRARNQNRIVSQPGKIVLNLYEVVTMHIKTSGETRLYGQPVGAYSNASQPFRPRVIPAIHYPYVVCDTGLCMQLQLIDQHASSPRFAYALCPCLYRGMAFRRNLIGESLQLAESGEAGSVWSGPCTKVPSLARCMQASMGSPQAQQHERISGSMRCSTL
jgi:hypothetical protein